MLLEPADIVFTDTGLWTSRLIKWGTQEAGEAPTLVSHVALAVDNSKVVEALGRGVVKRSLYKAYMGKKVAVYRCKSHVISKTDKIRVAAYAEELQDSVVRYSYLGILIRMVDALLGKLKIKSRLASYYKPTNFSECEQFVTKCFSDRGVFFGKALSPDDLWDYIISNPDDFLCIKPLGELY